MAFHVYILYSSVLDRYYVGHTENLEKRILEHRSGFSTYTAKAQDWVLKYQEKHPDRKCAYAREREIKAKKSRKYIEWLIAG